MANHKSAIKKYKRDLKKRVINKMNRTKMRNRIKLLRKTVEAKELDKAKEMYADVISIIDHSVTKGIIHKKTGSRYKSRITHYLRKSSVNV